MNTQEILEASNRHAQNLEELAIESYQLALYLWKAVPVQYIPTYWAVQMDEVNAKFDHLQIDLDSKRHREPDFK